MYSVEKKLIKELQMYHLDYYIKGKTHKGCNKGKVRYQNIVYKFKNNDDNLYTILLSVGVVL